jgi:uncharacterized membrane protein
MNDLGKTKTREMTAAFVISFVISYASHVLFLNFFGKRISIFALVLSFFEISIRETLNEFSRSSHIQSSPAFSAISVLGATLVGALFLTSAYRLSRDPQQSQRFLGYILLSTLVCSVIYWFKI